MIKQSGKTDQLSIFLNNMLDNQYPDSTLNFCVLVTWEF